jgi:hypothetical protein
MTVSEELPAGLTVPFVRYLPASTAASLVEMRGFVPVFAGPKGTGAWVRTQEPPPGTPAGPGSDVRMELSTGRIP